MTTQEFSNIFDTLLNSYESQAFFGDTASKREIVLDEYEKSVLLTQAQDIIVKQYFERTNTNLGFDESERRQIDFSNLITVGSVSTSESGSFADRSWTFDIQDATIDNDIAANVLFILNERLVLSKSNSSKTFVVVPINYREYDRQMSKPFAQPLKKQAWRLLQDDADSTSYETSKIEIVPTDVAYAMKTSEGYTATYKVRFIRRPRPIILIPLADSNLSIDGVSTVSECELNPILHMDIINKAVELAFATRGGKIPASGEAK